MSRRRNHRDTGRPEEDTSPACHDEARRGGDLSLRAEGELRGGGTGIDERRLGKGNDSERLLRAVLAELHRDPPLVTKVDLGEDEGITVKRRRPAAWRAPR